MAVDQTLVTQLAIDADRSAAMQIIQRELSEQEDALRSEVDLRLMLLHGDTSPELQRFAQLLDGRPFNQSTMDELEKLIHERGDDVRYVITLLLGALPKTSPLGLVVHSGRRIDNLRVEWRLLSKENLTDDELLVLPYEH